MASSCSEKKPVFLSIELEHSASAPASALEVCVFLVCFADAQTELIRANKSLYQ
jgi:hypothetical protein